MAKELSGHCWKFNISWTVCLLTFAVSTVKLGHSSSGRVQSSKMGIFVGKVAVILQLRVRSYKFDRSDWILRITKNRTELAVNCKPVMYIAWHLPAQCFFLNNDRIIINQLFVKKHSADASAPTHPPRYPKIGRSPNKNRKEERQQSKFFLYFIRQLFFDIIVIINVGFCNVGSRGEHCKTPH